MKIKFYFIGITTILAVTLISSIGCSNASSLAGVWELDRVENGSSYNVIQRFELFRDGTGNMEGVSIGWSAESNRIMLTAFGQAQSHDYRLSGSTLTIIYDTRTNHRAIYRKR